MESVTSGVNNYFVEPSNYDYGPSGPTFSYHSPTDPLSQSDYLVRLESFENYPLAR